MLYGAGQVVDGFTGVDPVKNVSRSLGISDGAYEVVGEMSVLISPGGIVKDSGKLLSKASKGEKLIKWSEEASKSAHNVAQYDKLKTYYQQAEKYGTSSINELSDGRFRFYEKIKPARTQGEMAGARHVREWNPQTGAKRDWYETLDHLGNIRQVRPSPDITGGVKVHYMFDTNRKYTGSWSPKK